MAGSTKLAVSENAASGATALNLGLTAPSATNNVTSLAANSGSGVITITYTAAAGNGTLIMIPTSAGAALSATQIPSGGSINWSCSSGSTSVKYRPSACR